MQSNSDVRYIIHGLVDDGLWARVLTIDRQCMRFFCLFFFHHLLAMLVHINHIRYFITISTIINHFFLSKKGTCILFFVGFHGIVNFLFTIY